MSTFDTSRVDDALRGTLFHNKLHHFTTIDSTNTRALADAHAGAEAGQVYIADEQTAGRGRGGHTWHSEPDSGLYMTVLIRPVLTSDDVLKLSLATGLAAQSALVSAFGFGIDLRWPNDLVTKPSTKAARKLGGILAESALHPDGAIRHVAIGIGINLNQETFPEEVAVTATSVRLEMGDRVQREPLVIALLHELHAEVSRLEAEVRGEVKQPFLNGRFLLSSTWVRGKRVHVAEDDGYTGTTDGLNASGLLRVQSDDGRLRTVRHGSVREL